MELQSKTIPLLSSESKPAIWEFLEFHQNQADGCLEPLTFFLVHIFAGYL